MNLEEIKQELNSLSSDDLDDLATYCLSITADRFGKEIEEFEEFEVENLE